MATVKQIQRKVFYKAGTCNREKRFLNSVLAIQDLMHPRPQRTQAMLSLLPVVVVSEHFMLKERLRKWETLSRIHKIFTASLMQASNLHNNTYPSSFSSSKNIGLPLWNNALKKVGNITYGKRVIFHQQPLEKVINYRGGWASDIKNNLFGEPRICFAVTAWFSSNCF